MKLYWCHLQNFHSNFPGLHVQSQSLIFLAGFYFASFYSIPRSFRICPDKALLIVKESGERMDTHFILLTFSTLISVGEWLSEMEFCSWVRKQVTFSIFICPFFLSFWISPPFFLHNVKVKCGFFSEFHNHPINHFLSNFTKSPGFWSPEQGFSQLLSSSSFWRRKEMKVKMGLWDYILTTYWWVGQSKLRVGSKGGAVGVKKRVEKSKVQNVGRIIWVDGFHLRMQLF